MDAKISAQIFEEIVSNFPDIIHSVNKDGVIISANRRATELLGYSIEELIGKSVFEIYADDIQKNVRSGFSQLKKSGSLGQIESKLKTKSGEIIEVEIRSLSIYDEHGNFDRTFTIIRDMRPMNQLKNQLVQQSKLAGIGELASGIMHDIRNPLTLIASYNNHFLKKAIENQDADLMIKCQSVIEKACNKIMHLSDHLRAYTRSDVANFCHFSAKEMMENSLLMLQQRIAEAGAKIENKITDDKLLLYGNENQIEQVFINLIGNAADAIAHCANKKIIIDYSVTDSDIILMVQDFGPGIPKENMGKIFESFFTTKEKGKGTGLGLSICSGIIRKHAGEIRVDSELGSGTVFSVVLPKKKND